MIYMLTFGDLSSNTTQQQAWMINPPCSTSWRIDRGDESAPSHGGRVWLAVAAGSWPQRLPHSGGGHGPRRACARRRGNRRSPAAVQPPPAPILDASGYVVARRQATVASKITAKMVELDIEEGDRVKAGQVIAKLDDTNIRAALNQAGAQLDYAKPVSRKRRSISPMRSATTNGKRACCNRIRQPGAVDNAQTTVERFAGATRHPAQQRRCRRARNERFRNAISTIPSCARRFPESSRSRLPNRVKWSRRSLPAALHADGIGTIVDMDSLEIQVDVNENFINRVRPAQQATAKLNAYPDWQIPAHVIAVIPTADRSKGNRDGAHRTRPKGCAHPARMACGYHFSPIPRRNRTASRRAA